MLACYFVLQNVCKICQFTTANGFWWFNGHQKPLIVAGPGKRKTALFAYIQKRGNKVTKLSKVFFFYKGGVWSYLLKSLVNESLLKVSGLFEKFHRSPQRKHFSSCSARLLVVICPENKEISGVEFTTKNVFQKNITTFQDNFHSYSALRTQPACFFFRRKKNAYNHWNRPATFRPRFSSMLCEAFQRRHTGGTAQVKTVLES